MIAKKIFVIPFLGGRVEVRNAYDYTNKAGQPGKGRPGVFICGLSPYPIECPPEMFGMVAEKLKDKQAKQILEHPDQ